MKISEYIKCLQEAKEKYGDLELIQPTDHGLWYEKISKPVISKVENPAVAWDNQYKGKFLIIY